jgi:hypothetical protein
MSTIIDRPKDERLFSAAEAFYQTILMSAYTIFSNEILIMANTIGVSRIDRVSLGPISIREQNNI